MHLIKLKIKNIASLKGEQVIDFESIQKESSLFAITGETGSGKSTILNAIGLALYGQVYKKNLGQLDLVTLGEKDGAIDLIFQVKNKYYLATWRAKVLKQNGEPYSTPQTPNRELYELSEGTFEANKQITLTKVEELLNLDFDQFCKCVILNQGEFARFISSSFSERKEILEKLYPGEVLEGLGRELKLELDTKLKEQNNLEIEMSTLGNSDFNEKELEQEIDKLKKLLNKFEFEFIQYDKIELSFNEFRTLLDKSQENKLKLSTIKEDLAYLTDQTNKIFLDLERSQILYEKTKTKQEKELPHLQILLKKEEQLKALKESIEIKTNQLGKLKNQIETSENALYLERTKSKTEQEKNLLLAKDFIFLTSGLKNIRPILGDYFDLLNQKDSMTSDLELRQGHLLQVQKNGIELKSSLDLITEKIKSFPTDLSGKLKSLNELKKNNSIHIERRQQSLLKLEAINEFIEKIDQEELNLNEQSQKLSSSLNQTTHKSDVVNREIKINELINSIELCFTHPDIKDSGTCPVCQTKHSQEKWKELEGLIKKSSLTELKNQWMTLEAEKARIISELNQAQEVLKKNKNLKEHKLQEQKKLLPDLELPCLDTEKLDQDIISIQKDIWEQRELTLKEERMILELKKARDQYTFDAKEYSLRKDNLELLKTKTHPLIEIIEKNLQIKEKDINHNDLKNDFKRLELFLEIENKIHIINQSISYIEANLQKTKTEWTQVNEELTLLQEKYGFLEQELSSELKDESATDLITKINIEVQKAHEIYQSHELQMKRKDLELKELQSKVYSLEELIKDFDLQSQKSFHNAQTYSKELLKMAQDHDSKIWPRKLLSLVHGDNIPREVIVEMVNHFRENKIHLKQETQAGQLKLGHLSAQMENHLKLKQKIDELKKIHERNDSQLNRLKNLFEVLGKDELRSFVLALVEENLITYTNHELQKLCLGRYELIHQAKKMGPTPDFYILDKFKNAGIRKISTLSGGETFMVSLAMALALGEMTRGQAELDTLFIDEGFGTLDQDSLEDVLDMLKQIQSRGPMIGLISHIKTLTDALTVNLNLIKRPDGSSRVNLEYN